MRFQDLLKSTAIASLMATSIVASSMAQEIVARQSGSAVLNPVEAASLGLSYLALADMPKEPTSDGWEYVGDALDLINTSLLSSIVNDTLALSSGFKAGIYRKGEDEYVVAFAGTGDPMDLITDIKNFVGLPTTQYQLAAHIAEAAVEKYPGVTFVGHSLGGGLAQYAALKTTNNAVVFNAAGSPIMKFWRPEIGDRLIAFNTDKDIAAHTRLPTVGLGLLPLGKGLPVVAQLGTEYVLKGGVISTHRLDDLRKLLEAVANKEGLEGQAVNWAQVKLFQGGALALISNNVSHMGSTAGSGSVPQGSSYNSGNNGLFVSASSLAGTQWFLIVGDELIHLGEHVAYGSIASPGGDPIFSLNNAGVTNTVIEKYFILPPGQSTFSFSTLADFVTTEFPEFVGTQFDDVGTITLITPAGETFDVTTIFSESVNASDFSPVSDLPPPMLKETGEPTGGHTGFETASVNNLPVAPGGTVTLRIEVENVGDTLYPSAVLVSGVEAR